MNYAAYIAILTPHGFQALGMGIADKQLAHVPANGVDRSLFLDERTERMQGLAAYVELVKL